jgi:hypothetical protein
MSKGSVPRPKSVPMKEFDNKWDAIFGKKDQQKALESQELNKQKGKK